MWKRGRCGTITPSVWDGAFYRIEQQSIVSGLRGANVRVEKRLDGSLAVRCGERYLAVNSCPAPEKPKAPVVKTAGRHRQPASQRGSDWNKNFDLQKAPKVWQGAQESGYQRKVAE
jgi:hypothetical protein